MKKWKTKNGMTVIHERKQSDSVAIQVLINLGSNFESKGKGGISHFIEHMVFEGTPKRKNAREIANEIEKIGGEMNAYTDKGRTCFYIKVLNKYFDVALDVLADILQNPLLRSRDVQREKNILLKEIDLVIDEPRFYQWILFNKALFKKHPSRNPTYGTKNSVRKTSRTDITHWFKKYYQPKNMIIAVVGDVKNVKRSVERTFRKKGKGKKLAIPHAIELEQNEVRQKKEIRKIENSYVVLGYRTVPRMHEDSYVLDVIDMILGKGQSGWLFDEIRNKKGLAYEVGTQHEAEADYGFFAAYWSTGRSKLGQVKKLVLRQLNRLKNASAEDVEEAKECIEGRFYLEYEDTQKLADIMVFWEQLGGVDLLKIYIDKIKKVSPKDVRRIAQKYFTENYCFVVIEGR